MMTEPSFSPSRRQFLTRLSLFGGFSMLHHTWLGAADAEATDRVVLLSDIHISEDPKRILRDTCMTDNLQTVVTQIQATLSQSPAKALCITGDISVDAGLKGDYEQVRRLMTPFEEKNLAVHYLMGNHDHREHCRAILGDYLPGGVELKPHVASKIELPQVNLYLLDSLIKTNHTPGEIGAAQIKWLEEELRRSPEKPSIILVHHYLRFDNTQAHNGILDSDALFDLSRKYPQLKAFIYGHSHQWELVQKEGKHLVNLPPVAYVFSKEAPNGWVDATFRATGMTLKLHTLDTQHPLSQKEWTLNWS